MFERVNFMLKLMRRQIFVILASKNWRWEDHKAEVSLGCIQVQGQPRLQKNKSRP